MGKNKSLPLQSGMRQGSTLSTLIQYNSGISSQSNEARERNKRDSNKEERNQTISISR
jgi:hypothetical protein